MSTSVQDGNLLEIRGLRIEASSSAGWVEIVKGIDLSVRPGEVVGLIGESGAGKSTIGLAAMGYARRGCRISGGEILLGDSDILQLDPKTRRRIRGRRVAYVAQSAAGAFNPARRLIDQYREVATFHGARTSEQATRDAVALYAELGLPQPDTFGERYPHQVSGGQLQRAMVAMALACRPELVVFDEPTTALDVTTQLEVLAAIGDVTRKFETGAIYVSHDLAVVAQVASRIMVLRGGETVEEGSTRQILTEPNEPYTASLIAARATTKTTKQIDASPILEGDAICARYRRSDLVLDDINLSLSAGETLAVVGESGSGKSTLARALAGLLPPVGGRVRFNGNVLPGSARKRDRETLRRIQLIYQSPDTALNPSQTVKEIIGRPLGFYFGRSREERKRRIEELLKQIELGPEFAERYPSELSGGQKQRVCIARALAAEPEILICDEVTSALDQLVGEGILRLLRDLQERLGLGYIFITHDLATVQAIADKVMVMQGGHVVESGVKGKVLEQPEQEYTRRLIRSVPKMDPDWLRDTYGTAYAQ